MNEGLAMPTPPATAYETDVKTLRKRVNYLRTENEALHAEIDRLQGALMVLHTWATVDNVLVTRHVVDLCERHLGMANA